MNNENNLVNETNNVQPTIPVAPQPVPQQAPVTPVAPTPQVTPQPVAAPTPVAPVQPQAPVAPTPVTPVAPVTPVQPKPVAPVAPQPAQAPTATPIEPHYSTPKINVNIDNERVFKGGEQVQLRDESKDYKAIEEQLGSSEETDTNSSQPQVASVSVAEVNNEIAKDNILSSITLDEDDNKQSGDAESVTFDYNAIYGNKTEEKEEVKEETNNEVFSATEINLQDRTRKKTDIAPEFNLNALDGDNNTIERSQDNVLSEKQQDRADTRRKIMFIGIIVVIIIIALEFIFPMFV